MEQKGKGNLHSSAALCMVFSLGILISFVLQYVALVSWYSVCFLSKLYSDNQSNLKIFPLWNWSCWNCHAIPYIRRQSNLTNTATALYITSKKPNFSKQTHFSKETKRGQNNNNKNERKQNWYVVTYNQYYWADHM